MTAAKQNRRAIRREAIKSAKKRSRVAGNTKSNGAIKQYFRTMLDRELKQQRKAG